MKTILVRYRTGVSSMVGFFTTQPFLNKLLQWMIHGGVVYIFLLLLRIPFPNSIVITFLISTFIELVSWVLVVLLIYEVVILIRNHLNHYFRR